MTDQQEFDLLRQTCSAALQQFISEARETERRMRLLNLPIQTVAARQVTVQRNVEVQAGEQYILSARQLAAFVEEHLYTIH